MPIVSMHQVGTNYPTMAVGAALAHLSWTHVAQLDGVTNVGFGSQNCNAAVAVQRDDAYASGYQDNVFAAGTINPPVVAVYGSSRLYGGLDPGFNATLFDPTQMNNPFSNSDEEQHAEQTAITFAEANGFSFWLDGGGNAHVYVDFTPCDKCEPWLRARAENWIVHYGQLLAQKSVFLKQRKERSRDIKTASREQAAADRKARQMLERAQQIKDARAAYVQGRRSGVT